MCIEKYIIIFIWSILKYSWEFFDNFQISFYAISSWSYVPFSVSSLSLILDFNFQFPFLLFSEFSPWNCCKWQSKFIIWGLKCDECHSLGWLKNTSQICTLYGIFLKSCVSGRVFATFVSQKGSVLLHCCFVLHAPKNEHRIF